MPNWFHTLFFNNIMLKKTYVIFNKLSKIIKERCKNGLLKKLKDYAFDNNINEEAVLNAAILHFLFAGGNKSTGNIIKRFELSPRDEYNSYFQNKNKYILELCRLHAMIAPIQSNIAQKSYKFKVKNKIINIPKGTAIGCSTMDVNDNIKTQYPLKFNPNRSRDVYHNAMTWHCKDEYFFNKQKRLPSRFCPGRIIMEPHLIDVLDRLFVELKKQFEFSENKLIDIDEIHDSLSSYNKTIIGLLVPGIRKWNKDDSHSKFPLDIELDDDNPNKYPLKLATFNLGDLALLDDDIYFDRDFIKDSIFSLVSKLTMFFPFKDDSILFDDNTKDGKKMMKLYLKQKCEMPRVNVVWKDLKSDDSISLFAFGSVVNILMEKMNDETYQSDVSHLSKYKVRNGFHCYGAIAYFDKHYKLTSIYISHLDKRIYCNDIKNIGYAKYVYLTSIIGLMTLVNHAFITHMIESAALSKCMCESLPHNHWLSRFLLIFTFRTNYINESIHQILMKKNGLVHRIWGFEYSSVEKIAKYILDNYDFTPFYERYDLSMKNTPDEIFPFIIDSKEYYDCIYNFTQNYVNSYYNENDSDHKYIQYFYENICKNLKINDENNNQCEKNKLCHVITNLICTVTAYHEQVGGVMDYVNIKLDWLDTKLYKNKSDICQVSKNDFVASAALVMLTGVRNPGIINDFKHILLKDDKLEKNKQIFDKWQNELNQLAERINQRNKKRRIAFNACNPANIE
eukprot:507573_1